MTVGQSLLEGIVLLEIYLVEAVGNDAHLGVELSHIAVELGVPIGGGSGAQNLHVVLHGRSIGGGSVLIEHYIQQQLHAVGNESGIGVLLHIAVPLTSPAHNGLLQSSEVGAVIVGDAFLHVSSSGVAEITVGVVPHYNVLVSAGGSGCLLAAAHDTLACASACSIEVLHGECITHAAYQATYDVGFTCDVEVGVAVLYGSGTTHVAEQTTAVGAGHMQLTGYPHVLHCGGQLVAGCIAVVAMTNVATQHARTGLGAIDIHILEAHIAHASAQDAEHTCITVVLAGEVGDDMAAAVKVNEVAAVLAIKLIALSVEGIPILAVEVDIIVQNHIVHLTHLHQVVQSHQLIDVGYGEGIILGAGMPVDVIVIEVGRVARDCYQLVILAVGIHQALAVLHVGSACTDIGGHIIHCLSFGGSDENLTLGELSA